jgi:hypothetical protein
MVSSCSQIARVAREREWRELLWEPRAGEAERRVVCLDLVERGSREREWCRVSRERDERRLCPRERERERPRLLSRELERISASVVMVAGEGREKERGAGRRPLILKVAAQGASPDTV